MATQTAHLRALLFALVCLGLGSVPASAGALAPPPTPGSAAPPAKLSKLVLTAEPLLGPNAPAVDGWVGIAIRITNKTKSQLSGKLELVSSATWASDDHQIVTRTSFALSGGQTATLRLPTHGFAAGNPTISVRALADNGEKLVEYTLPDLRPAEPLLFHLSETSRIAGVIRGQQIPKTSSTSSSRRGFGNPQVAVTLADRSSAGDLVLPERSAEYASATVVLVSAETLASLQGQQRDALVGWVLAGGALAVTADDSKWLEGDASGDRALTRMVGAVPQKAEPHSDLLAQRSFEVPSGSSYSSGTSLKTLGPGPAVARALTGWTGGNLRPSPFGASATYGLGEVHLLAFDPNSETAAADTWVQLTMVDLLRHTWQRSKTVVMPLGSEPPGGRGTDDVRRQLDPNEGGRWAIIVSALLLLIYAVLAGPVNFYLAARKGKPLRALWHLPLWSLGTMLLIVLLGVISKGVKGRARHLTLVEAGAGSTRAAATRFRGFFASSSQELTVYASTFGSVLDVAGEGTARELVVDRDGARLEKFRSKPWQTVVVREDGFIELGGGIGVEREGSDVKVTNRTARDLLAVVVKPPRDPARFIPRIKDGQSVLASTGKQLNSRLGGGSYSPRPLGAGWFSDEADSVARGSGPAWQALADVAQNGSDWWPEDVPVVLAQIEGGEGKSEDSGLKLESDRVLVRVVGWGGTR